MVTRHYLFIIQDGLDLYLISCHAGTMLCKLHVNRKLKLSNAWCFSQNFYFCVYKIDFEIVVSCEEYEMESTLG